jgi:acyl carrier protein
LPENRKHLLSTFVHNTVRRVLGVHDSELLDPTQPLTDYGLDSLMAVQMRNAMANSLQHPLPVSLVFNYPTVNDMVDYMETQLHEFFGVVEPSGSQQNSGRDQQNGDSPLLAAQEVLAEINALLNEEG